MKKILILIFALTALIACDEKSENVLSSSKMEDVLYDYHKAQAMIDQLNFEDREKKSQAYIDAVFEKNNITEAEFDSSLVYYNRHAKEFNTIYTNIKKRLDAENKELSLETGNDIMSVYSLTGDTANIWNGRSMIVLRGKEGLNYDSFVMTADSSFHRKDKFILACNSIIISSHSSDQDNYINVGFTITYTDGKVSATTMKTGYSRELQLTLSAYEDKDIASVSGYFYFNSNKENKSIAFINKLGLVRMHTEKPIPVKADSVKADSTQSIDIKVEREEHLTPEQIRKLNQSDNRINIKAAPDVRTPNSDFRRRKRVRK